MVTYIVISLNKIKSVHSSLADAKREAKKMALKTGTGHRISKEVLLIKLDGSSKKL